MRLNNIKMVKPELSDSVEQFLIGLLMIIQKIVTVLTESTKEILLSTQQPKREFKINRV